MEFVKIGKVLNTHGIKGDLKVAPYTDFIKERFKKDSVIYFGEDKIKETVKSYRSFDELLLLRLNEKEDINLVERYKFLEIFKSVDDIEPLKKGYYFKDLADLDVYVEDELVGVCLRCEEGVSSNYIRVKKTDGSEALIPFIEKVFIKSVDLAGKRIDVVKMEGLL